MLPQCERRLETGINLLHRGRSEGAEQAEEQPLVQRYQDLALANRVEAQSRLLAVRS